MSDNNVTSKPKSLSFDHFLPEILTQLENISDAYLDDYDDHKAFVYLIADLFETTEPTNFMFTDGAKDGGIDFLVQDQETFSIFQCKCPDLTILQQKSPLKIPKFDQAPLEELVSAIEMMLDNSGAYDVKATVKQFRGDYQHSQKDDEAPELNATLAIMGELTQQAHQAFKAFQQQFEKRGVNLKLIDWKKLHRELHALDTPNDINISFEISVENKNKDLLAHTDYCYVLAHAFDFYQAFRKHQWNLFDWNVRFQIHKSPINKRIVKSLKTRKGRKIFHHLNNGLLITCKQYSGTKKQDNFITVTGAQIINGCQTVRSICEAYEELTPDQQEEFREEARVQVKIIRTTDVNFINELVISTNDQNPMRSRNLKSNSHEQRDLQNQFRNLPVKWFYERKDGEWDSLNISGTRIRSFRSSDYIVPKDKKGGRPKYRKLDNRTLAKYWYAFLGYSHRVASGTKYFEDDVYKLIFKSIPTPSFWSAFRKISFTPKEEYFEQGIPSPHQYLLAYSISEYISGKKVSSRLLKTRILEQAVSEKKLKSTYSKREADEYLEQNSEYNINRLLVNMGDVLSELYGYIITLKYSDCDPSIAQRLLNLEHELVFIKSGFNHNVLPEKQNGNTLFGPTYEFLKYCVKQFYYEYQSEIRVAPRIKTYLAQRATVDKLRRIVHDKGTSLEDYDVQWKKIGKTFLDSLPEI